MEMLNKGIKVAVYEPLIDKGEFLKGAEIVGFLESIILELAIILEIWRSSIILNSVLTNKEIANLGYITMTDYYLKIREN